MGFECCSKGIDICVVRCMCTCDVTACGACVSFNIHAHKASRLVCATRGFKTAARFAIRVVTISLVCIKFIKSSGKCMNVSTDNYKVTSTYAPQPCLCAGMRAVLRLFAVLTLPHPNAHKHNRWLIRASIEVRYVDPYVTTAGASKYVTLFRANRMNKTVIL